MTDTAPFSDNPRRLAAAAAATAVVLGLLTHAGAQDADAPEQPAGQAAAAQEPGAQENDQPGTATAPTRADDSGGITRRNGGLVLNFQDASIDVVLDELSEAAGFIIVKESATEGRVTLTSRQPVSPEDAVELVNTVLHNAGYSAIRQGRILKIVRTEDARHLNIPVRSGADPEDIPATDELITQVIPLRHADAMQLLQDLQPLVNPEADFAANASSNALVITDTSANVRRVVEIIAALDTSLAGSVEVKVFPLEYANAVNAATLINDVFGDLSVGPGGEGGGGGRDRDGGRGGDIRDRMRQMMEQQQGGPRGSNVNAAADERTNMLVVTGPGDTLEIVATVIEEIDSNPVADETVFVYRLRNAQAINIEGVLNSIFGDGAVTTRGRTNTTGVPQNPLLNFRGGTGGAGGASRGAGRGAGGFGGGGGGGFGGGGFGGAGAGAFGGRQFGNFQQPNRGGGSSGRRVSNNARQAATGMAGQVTIIADVDTNSLLVRTSPQNYEQVQTVLEELDRPVAQVLIKVLIAEVTHEDGLDLGAEISILNLRANGLGQTYGTNFNVPTEGASATGVVVQVLEEDFSAAIRALETDGKLDVLSRPYILASDNQVASITVGQEVPFITNSRVTDQGGIINTITYDDIGILLDVIPHINPDGLVILDVAPEISTLTGTTVPISELVNAPVIAKRSALSRVAVNNGQTIVIGGLMEDRKTQTINKVPILGDIPLLGNLFKRTQTNKVKTELLIFLTPHVASDPEMLDTMRDDEVDGARLVPNAVSPGEYERHIEGLQRGNTTELEPTTRPLDITTIPATTRPGRRTDRGADRPTDAPRQEPRQE